MQHTPSPKTGEIYKALVLKFLLCESDFGWKMDALGEIELRFWPAELDARVWLCTSIKPKAA